jgi:16S rRNA processing protein RimM
MARPRRRPARPRSAPPRLSETAGPDPGTPPERVRLTIGTIVAPHGVRGEFKLRLQTDDPEHLLTLKRVYLGEERTPRTVLGTRMHAGNALMRLQGISSPETVERFRGVPLKIRGSEARPLAANEYFLYQIIDLEAFDEAGTRLGRVTDLMKTGANDVLVITPDEGSDLLLPSHPDVIISMDPSAGTIVVRPLEYYGE